MERERSDPNGGEERERERGIRDGQKREGREGGRQTFPFRPPRPVWSVSEREEGRSFPCGHHEHNRTESARCERSESAAAIAATEAQVWAAAAAEAMMN